MNNLAPRAFGGGALKGSNLVRFIYLDEAGISDPRYEPYVVTAGPLVHSDKQWKSLSRRLAKIADEHVPEEYRENFSFHATELFSGGKVFSRERFEKERRWKILEELVSIPGEMHLPITYGAVEREKWKNPHINLSVAELTLEAQGAAYVMCVGQAEAWMRNHAESDELAMVIMENNNQARTTISSAHHFARDLHKIQRPVSIDAASGRVTKTVPLFSEEFGFERVIEDPHFAEKEGSSPLQIADICAFVIKRKLMNAQHCDRFFEPLGAHLIGGLPLYSL